MWLPIVEGEKNEWAFFTFAQLLLEQRHFKRSLGFQIKARKSVFNFWSCIADASPGNV
jgi:hypothetical protein